MQAARVIFVTGKGGVGKTTVAAALGQYAAHLGHWTLIVETASDGRLAALFAHRALDGTPRRLRTGLDAVRVDARQLVEQYFARLLRFQWLSNRLLSSNTFNALTAAATSSRFKSCVQRNRAGVMINAAAKYNIVIGLRPKRSARKPRLM